MSGPINPINSGFVNNAKFHADQAHGPWPNHMDMMTRSDILPGIVEKFRIDTSGNILSYDLRVGNRFLKDLGLDKY